jgi:DNA repair exonuclease SbcCD ATPase subunit
MQTRNTRNKIPPSQLGSLLVVLPSIFIFSASLSCGRGNKKIMQKPQAVDVHIKQRKQEVLNDTVQIEALPQTVENGSKEKELEIALSEEQHANQKKLEDSGRKLDDAINKIKELEKEIEARDNSHPDLGACFSEKDAEKENLQTECNDLKNKIKELEKEIEARANSDPDVEAHFSERDAEKENLKTEYSDLQRKLYDAMNEIKELKEKIRGKNVPSGPPPPAPPPPPGLAELLKNKNKRFKNVKWYGSTLEEQREENNRPEINMQDILTKRNQLDKQRERRKNEAKRKKENEKGSTKEADTNENEFKENHSGESADIDIEELINHDKRLHKNKCPKEKSELDKNKLFLNAGNLLTS